MSYDIDLMIKTNLAPSTRIHNEECDLDEDCSCEPQTFGLTLAQVALFQEGGTQVMGGSTEAALNVTWNYSYFFRAEIDREEGIRWIYDKTGAATAEVLRRAVKRLGNARHDDYWAPTPGNAGHALSILLRWAEEHPTGIWKGD